MRKLLTTSAACLAALMIPAAAEAQNGNGNGKGNGGGAKAERGQDRGGGGENRGRGNGGGNGNGGGQERGGGDDRGRGRGGDRVEVRASPSGAVVIQRGDDDRGRGRGSDDRREMRDEIRREVRRAVEDRTGVVIVREDRARNLIPGCPPGLAKKNNGCLPPGQARQIASAQAWAPQSSWDRLWWNDGDDDWRYRDGYLYRVTDNNGVSGWLPVLGGALGLNQVWPQQYEWRPAPAYYADYWNLPDRYQYRYADGVLYGVDPETQAIGAVAALLTGQPWTVGQPMPTGFDVYNVPYAYRGQYMDTNDAWYRYNDGYVYQVDPTTQLVQAVIQLLV